MAEKLQIKHSDAELDASGFYSPLPVLRAKKVLDQMPDESVLKLIATDPGSVKDVEAFAGRSACRLLDTEHSENCFVFYLQKRAN